MLKLLPPPPLLTQAWCGPIVEAYLLALLSDTERSGPLIMKYELLCRTDYDENCEEKKNLF